MTQKLIQRLKHPKELIILVVFLLLVGGVSAFLLTTKESPPPNNSSNSESPEPPQPTATDEPKPAEAEPYALKLDDELPKGTLSPHEVASNPDQYSGKEIRVRGLIVESSQGQYSITSQEPSEQHGLRLVFDKSIDLQPYINTGFGDSEEPPQLAGPVTISGKLANIEQGQPLGFKIQSLEQ
jgi:hypothetical protein